jgi:uncharacterized protein
MPYLVDGHNLIPKIGLRLDSPDDEMELVAILQEFCRRSRREVHVYFDGAPAGEARSHKFANVTAHFVRQGSSADAAIRAHILRLGRAARNWTVVSSDREVQSSARAGHAAAVSSEEFAGSLRRLEARTGHATGDMQLSSDEVSEWLRFFSSRK